VGIEELLQNARRAMNEPLREVTLSGLSSYPA